MGTSAGPADQNTGMGFAAGVGWPTRECEHRIVRGAVDEKVSDEQTTCAAHAITHATGTARPSPV